MRKILGINPVNPPRNLGYILLGFIIIACIIGFLAGCGSDDITGSNNGNNPTPVFTLDSVGIYGSGHQLKLVQDTLHLDSGNMQLTFSVETNCDSLQDSAWIYLTAFVPGDTTYIQQSLPIRNASYTFNNVIKTAFIYFDFRVEFNSLQSKYLRFRNIKIYN